MSMASIIGNNIKKLRDSINAIKLRGTGIG